MMIKMRIPVMMRYCHLLLRMAIQNFCLVCLCMPCIMINTVLGPHIGNLSCLGFSGCKINYKIEIDATKYLG